MIEVPNSLQQAINKLHPLSDEAAGVFFAAWKHWVCPRDCTILREGQVADYIWFTESGTIRIFYKKDEKEITEWLGMNQTFFMSITSFFKRTSSRLIIHTLEPTQLWGIHFNDFMRLAAVHHEIETLLRKMVTGSLILSQARMESIQFETALQRYHRLLSTAPGIVQRVPMQYIASFLGITKETLSRIRSIH